MNNSPNPLISLVLRHIILLFAVLVVLGGVYTLSQNITLTTMTGVLMVLVHLLVVSGFLYFGGSRLVKFIQKLHEPPADQTISDGFSQAEKED